MSSHSSQHQSFGLADSPMSSLSSPSSPSFPDGFTSAVLADRKPHTTVYDVLYSAGNPSEFYNGEKKLVTAGCPHLARFKKLRSKEHDDPNIVLSNNTNSKSSNNDRDQWDLFSSYRSLVRYSLTWHKNQKALSASQNNKKRKRSQQLPLPQCSICLDPLSRLHMCLHCMYMGCWRKGHMRDHMKEEKHTFAMDFAHRTIYCSECGDYVYDTEMNDLIVRQETLLAESGHKRRRKMPNTANASWEPSNQEVSNVVNNSSLTSCQGIRGLCNMGNTCFMNVILQSFLHNPLLKAYFLSDQHSPSRCQTKFCLCCEMDTLFAQFYSGKKEPYGPCSFLQSMWMSVKELAGYAQQDAHEFFISALNNIHAGCEGHSMSNCTCIVHKTFAGLLQSNVTCLRCSNVTTTFDPMLDISLGLRPVEKRKKGISLSSGGPSTHVQSKPGGPNAKNDTPFSNGPVRRSKGNTLMDCLDRYTHPEKLGPNEYSCSKCGNTFQEATKQLFVKHLPPVLCFQLKRFEHGVSAQKIETKIKFPMDLDMTPYIADARHKSKGSSEACNANLYTLFAVINHHGKIDSGHYTMYAKHRGEWFKFEDHNVTTSLQKEVLESKAYMCFYIQKSLEYGNPLDDALY